MAIPETSKKIHWNTYSPIKGRLKDISDAPTVTLNHGKFNFNPKLITELDLDGKFIQFAFDPTKRVIGFRIREQIDLSVMKNWHLVRPNATSGFYQVTLNNMLRLFHDGSDEKKFKNVPIQKYREANGADAGDVLYFIKLEDEYVDTSEPRKYGKRTKTLDASIENATKSV